MNGDFIQLTVELFSATMKVIFNSAENSLMNKISILLIGFELKTIIIVAESSPQSGE